MRNLIITMLMIISSTGIFSQEILKETVILDPLGFPNSPVMIYNTKDSGYIILGGRGKVPENIIFKLNKDFDSSWSYSFRSSELMGNIYFLVNQGLSEKNNGFIYTAFWAGSKSFDWGYFYSFTLSDSGKLVSNLFKNDTNELYYGTTSFISVNDSNYLAYGMDAYFNNKSIFLKKIDKFGDKIWIKYYKDSTDSELMPMKLLLDSNSNPTIFSLRSNPNESRKLFLLRCDKNGNEIHRKIIDISFNTMQDIVQAEDGNYLFLSVKIDSNNNYYTYLVKLDNAGNIIWEQNYSFNEFTIGRSISILNNKYYICGDIGNWDKFKSKEDTATVKSMLFAIDLKGIITWKKTWDLKNMNYLRSSLINSKNNIVVIGYHNDKIFISEISNKTTELTENQKVEKGIEIFPNPVSDYLTLNPNQETGIIEIFSALGLKVLETEWKEKINVSDLPNGIYFATIKSGGNIETKQFIILR